jgi:adenylate kinase family enzyme
MKVFIIGLPTSGRTTVAKAIAQTGEFVIINATTWVKHTFRDQNPDEHIQQYQDEYYQYYSDRLKINPYLCIDNALDIMDTYKGKELSENNFVIDGIVNPKDFVHLFDVNKDIVVFLNRTDNQSEHKDCEGIAVSVIRDYCFWMSSINLLPSSRWIEYNFKIPGENINDIKTLGSKNRVFIAKSIDRVVSHLNDYLLNYK